MKRLKLLCFLSLTILVSLQAQNRRYFDQIFTDVTVTPNITYGVNASVLELSVALQAIPKQLKMNVYTPTGDTETARPLVIILHSGNFLPPTVNGGCSGTIFDADNVEIATRLAKMGYVAAVADYRIGWNPVASTQTERVATLINAAYRGVQDSRTCIRFFKADHAAGNQFGIDPNKITLWGIGAGGYIAAASATLDNVADTYIPKFLTAQGPMIIEAVNGNVDGTTVGVTFPGYPVFPAGDTLCYANHVGVSSTFGLALNLGGALGDTSWIDPNDLPMISFHVPSDPFAPCGNGIVNVPPPVNLPVVEVTGSCGFQPIVNAEGLNNVMINANFSDALSVHAKSINGNIEGFYPFNGLPVSESSPWSFASSDNPYGLSTNPNCETMALSHSATIDTIIRYFAPRACAVFGLSADCALVNTQNLHIDAGLSAIPNPSAQDFILKADERFLMQSVEMVDISGRVCARYDGINANQFTVKRSSLKSGVYFARVIFREGISTQKVVLH
jgi:hypothetical protein